MKYELMLIFLPDLGEEQTNKELQEVKELITSEGGEIYHEDIWGVRDFAYRIKKQDQGFYVVLNFSLDPSKLKKMENPMNLNQKLVRFLVTKTPNDYEIKTLEEYETEAEEEEKEKEKAEKSEEKRKPARPVKKEKKVVAEKVETPKKEEKEEVKKEEKEAEEAEPKEESTPKEEKVPAKEEVEEPKEAPKETPKDNLDDLDERLKSIINDPDISL